MTGSGGLSNPHEMLQRFGGREKLDLNSILCNERDDDPTETLYDAKFMTNYLDLDSFCQNYKNTNNLFKTISVNVESINAKHDLILTLIETLKTSNSEPDAILCQECWLSKEKCNTDALNLLKIPGYNTIAVEQKCGKKGGLLIYLKEEFQYVIRKLYEDSKDWEAQIVDVMKKNNKPLQSKITLLNIYRPPRDNYSDKSIDKCLKPLSKILQPLAKEKSTLITGGDFNINLLKILQRTKFQDFFELLTSYGSIPQVTLPTHYSKRNATLIDNIFLRPAKKVTRVASGVIATKISDHLPCFSIINCGLSDQKNTTKIQIRKQDPEAIQAFKNEVDTELNRLSPDPSLNQDPNPNYIKIDKILRTAKENNFPVKEVNFNKYRHKKNPWITTAILQAIKLKDKLYVNMVKSTPDTPQHEIAKNNFKSHCALLQKWIRRTKTIYYNKQFENFKSDIKKTWQHINEVLSRGKSKSELPNFIICGDKTLTNNKEIADCFNKFYSNIGPQLANSIKSPPNQSYSQYLNEQIKSRLNFTPVTTEEVLKIIGNLKSKSSSGHDGISSIILKEIKHSIAPILTLCINQSIFTGIFPNLLKNAIVKPVYKKENPNLMDNYRPISLLPIISKVFEKVVFKQTYEYFVNSNLLYDSQYGFRKGHSTELATLEFADRVLESLETGKIPLAVFLDLSKAFDTIDHSILINKLHYYGIRGAALDWFKSYLTNRKQTVMYKDQYSDEANIVTGVPQGSILGPLLFIIYMNDITQASDKFKFTLYADDTSLVEPLCTFETEVLNISQSVNNELVKITNWLALNKLSLNAKKTKMMLFHHSKKNVNNLNLKLYINGIPIEKVKSFKFLGTTLDENMSWNVHAKIVRTKIATIAGTLYRLKRFLPKQALHTIYNALIQPHLNFGILLWGKNSSKIFKLQKRAIRAITNSKYNAHTDPLFKNLRILKIHDMYNINLYKFYYRLKHNDLPAYFYNMFSEVPEHEHNLRHRLPLNLCLWKSQSAKISIRHTLPSALQTVSPLILDNINCVSYKAFTTNTKKILMDSYEEQCTKLNCYVCKGSK